MNRQLAYYHANKVRMAAANKRWRAANREADITRMRKYRKDNKHVARRGKGLPAPTRPEPQHCECCGMEKGDKTLHLDHDHVTGAFRGWLCARCNLGIGLLRDCVDGIINAALYLTRAERS